MLSVSDIKKCLENLRRKFVLVTIDKAFILII